MISLQAEASALTVVDGIEETMLVTGMANVASVQVTFSEDWDNLHKTIMFSNGDRTITHIMEADDEEVPIPSEVLAVPGRMVYVGVQGSDGDRVILPTIKCKLARVLISMDPNGDPAAIPTKPQWEQIREDLEELSESAASSAEAAGRSAGQAADSATAANNAKNLAQNAMTGARDYERKAEGYAVGTQNDIPVEEGSPYYHNNAAWLKDQAAGSATAAADSAAAAEAAAASITTDKTLTIEGKAADAKVTGERIAQLHDTQDKGVVYWKDTPSSYTQNSEETNNAYTGTVYRTAYKFGIKSGFSTSSGVMQMVKLDSDSFVAGSSTAFLTRFTWHATSTRLSGSGSGGYQDSYDRTLSLRKGRYRVTTKVSRSVKGAIGLVGSETVYAFEMSGSTVVPWSHGGELLQLGETGYFELDADDTFALYAGVYSWQTTFTNDIEVEITIERLDMPIIRILAIGNSFTQDAFGYVPAIIHDAFPDLPITFGVLYRSGTEIGAYAAHPNSHSWDGSATIYNEWTDDATGWTRYSNKYSLNDVLTRKRWNIIYGQVTCTTSGTGYIATYLDAAVADSKAMMDIIRAHCNNVRFMTGTWLAWGNASNNGEIGAVGIARFIEDCVAAGAFEDYIPIGAAIQDARTNPYLQRLGDVGNMRYNRTSAYGSGHMQNGTPALIAAYTIAAKLIQWMGYNYRGILGSAWVPTADNIVAIGCMTQSQMDGNGVGMTHGRPVFMTAGDDKTPDLYAAQEIAIRAIENPNQVVPWDKGAYADNIYSLDGDAYDGTKVYSKGSYCVQRNGIWKCTKRTVAQYDASSTYGKDSYVEKDNTVYIVIAPYDATKTYLIGDFAKQSTTLYRCTTDVSVPEAFDGGKWTAIGQYDESATYNEGDYVINGSAIQVYATGITPNWVTRGGALDANAAWYGIYAAAPFDTSCWTRTTLSAEARALELQKAPVIINSTSEAAVASVSDGADSEPARSLVVGIEPVQDLHGYEYPWPAGGGVNLLPPPAQETKTAGTTTCTTDGNGNYHLTAVSDSNSRTFIFDLPSSFVVPENSYLHLRNNATSSVITISFRDNDGTAIGNGMSFSSQNRIINIASDIVGQTVYKIGVYKAPGATDANITFSPMTCADDTVRPFVPYSNICPITGWTGANVVVSPTLDAADGTTYPVSWQSEAGTVYGGTLDVVTGLLTVDRAKTSVSTIYSVTAHSSGYNYWYTKDFPGKNSVPICNEFVGATGVIPGHIYITNAGQTVVIVPWPSQQAYTKEQANAWLESNPCEICYELATPITYQLTPVEVDMLLGENNVWADCGPIKTLQYPADTKLYIDNKITAAIAAALNA